jgi:hypothetical protein
LFCAVERTRGRCAHSACRVTVLAALCVRAAYAWPLRDKGVSFMCAHVFRSLLAFVLFLSRGAGCAMSWSKMRFPTELHACRGVGLCVSNYSFDTHIVSVFLGVIHFKFHSCLYLIELYDRSHSQDVNARFQVRSA